jgi:hypothetical protein
MPEALAARTPLQLAMADWIQLGIVDVRANHFDTTKEKGVTI